MRYQTKVLHQEWIGMMATMSNKVHEVRDVLLSSGLALELVSWILDEAEFWCAEHYLRQ